MPKITIEERFTSDITNHKITGIYESKEFRRIKYRNPNSSCYWFEIVTWPGCLCINGDMGTYVFSRLPDMFEFFRQSESWKNKHPNKLRINRWYWSKNLQGAFDGQTKYSPEKFIAAVTDDFEDFEFETPKEKTDAWREIEKEVLDYAEDGENSAMNSVYNFRSINGFQFNDFWEHNLTEYTFQYTWCLYAIVWGISQYDLLDKRL